MSYFQKCCLLRFAELPGRDKDPSELVGTWGMPVSTFRSLHLGGLVEPVGVFQDYRAGAWRLTAAGEEKVRELTK